MEFGIEYGIGIFIGFFISLIGASMTKWSSKIEHITEIVLAVIAIIFYIWVFQISDVLIMIALTAHSYFSFYMIFPNRRLLGDFKRNRVQVEEKQILFSRSFSRIFADILIMVILSLLSVLFIMLAPVTSFAVKIFLLFGLITAISGVVNRVWKFYTLKVYVLPDENELMLLTNNEPKKYPLESLKELRIESGVDLLRLNSMFSLFTSSVDYSTRFDRVLRLVFPGEIIYLTVQDTDKWFEYFQQFVSEKTETTEKKINRMLDGKTIRRLLGKGYFAVSVKGISAYTSLFLILFWIEAPYWVISIAVVLYWAVNLLISDKVLKIAMDAEEIDDPEILKRAQKIFDQAGLKNTKLYKTESADYNALATGINVGRAMITLTTETLKMDAKHIEAIIAHEVVHVKKRDVLLMQFARLVYLGFLAAFAYFSIDLIQSSGDEIIWFMIPFMWVLMMGFGMYLSFVAQIGEVRADHLGASFIEKDRAQMAGALTELAVRQENSMKKSSSYQLASRESNNQMKSLERNSWLFRFLEFQFLPHPPMYWRINSLNNNDQGWGKAILKTWWMDRLKDSLPDFRKKKTSIDEEKNVN